MIQMTTPDVSFLVDVDLTGADEVSVTFRQNGENVLVLDKDALTITSTKITHTFTQEETGLFSARKPLRIQIKALVNGRVISHKKPVETSVYEIFDKRVFGDE